MADFGTFRPAAAGGRGIPVISESAGHAGQNSESIVPCTLAQQRLWHLENRAPGVAACIHRVVRLRGALDVAALQKALDKVVARHEAPRSTFTAGEQAPMQVIHPPAPVPLPLTDLSACARNDREAAMLRVAEEAIRRPFDLNQGPLFRASLIRLNTTEHVLLLAMHAMVSDPASLDVLLYELGVFYGGFVAASVALLPPLPMRCSDYARWQSQWLQSEAAERDLAYWRRQLQGAPALLELPTDYPRPAERSQRSGWYDFTIPEALTRSLKEISRQENVDYQMTLLAGFKALLSRYSGQETVVVGIPVAGRRLANIGGMIGCFAHAVALRSDLAGTPSFRNLLRQVRATTANALNHQDIPFAKLVEEMSHPGEGSHHPLFQVVFAFQGAAPGFPVFPGLELQPLKPLAVGSPYDLTLSLTEERRELRGRLEYSTDLFNEATIARMAGNLCTLLDGAMAKPDQPVAALPLLTREERYQMLVRWNATKADYPADRNLHQLIEAHADTAPESVAVEFEGRQLTYRELDRRANQLAHLLREYGVRTETPVGIYMERSLELAVGVLGILKAGGVCVPLDPAYPQSRLAFMLEDSRTPVLLAQPGLQAPLPEHGARVVCLDPQWTVLAGQKEHRPESKVTPENLAYIVYTSGSTGKPRGVLLPHRGLVNEVTAAAALYEIGPEDRVLQFASISFDGAIEEFLASWTQGAALILRSPAMSLGGSHFLQWLRANRISVMSLPTAFWHEWVEDLARLRQPLPETLRTVVVGGEKASARAFATWRKVVGNQVRWVNTYGPSEATVIATAYLPADTDGAGEAVEEVPIGRPIANTKLYVLDRNLQPVPVGVPGELCIGGDGLARGYLNRPELTHERFIWWDPGSGTQVREGDFGLASLEQPVRLYRTGDLVRYRPDGNLEFLGRLDHQVKIRGFRVELGEIEAVLGQHPTVRECVVLAHEDTPGEKRLVAYVVPDAGATFAAGELRRSLKETLPEYMVPAAFVVLDAFPLTPNGKVDRRALPAPDRSAPENEPVGAAPSTALEQVLAMIWAEALERDSIGVEDNFFEVGGHSLLAMQVLSHMREMLQVELPLRALFEAPTVAALAKVICRNPEEGRMAEEAAGLLLELLHSSEEPPSSEAPANTER